MKSSLKRKNFFAVGVLTALLGFFAEAGGAEPNLVSWWKFDEGIGSTAYDSAGSNHGTVHEAQWSVGQIGDALSFDGVNDYVKVKDDISLDFGTSNFSISAWIKIEGSSYGTDHTIVGKRKPTGDKNQFLFSVVDATGKLSLKTRDASLSAITGVTVVNDGNWYHVVAVRNSNGMTELYVDGVLDNSTSLAVRNVDSNAFLGIGRHSTQGNNYFNGKIDGVRIYDSALTAEEVQKQYRGGMGNKAFNPEPADGATSVDLDEVLSWMPGRDAVSHDVYFGTGFNNVEDATTDSAEYMGNQEANNWGTNNLEYDTIYYWRIDEVNGPNTWKGDVWRFTTGELVSWWKFDEGSETIAYDSAGNNHGTIRGAQWSAGQFDCALDFDGSNDRVEVPDDESFYFGMGSFSISAWIKIEGGSNGPEHTIVGKRKPTGDKNAFHFCVVDATGKLSLKTRDASPSKITGVTDVNDGNWYHVAAVRNSNGMMELYVNGLLDASASLTVRDVDSDGFLGIGVHSTLRAGYFNGLIDDIRIYNRALSVEDIQQIYLGGLGNMVGLEIIGPVRVKKNYETQYTAVAHYDNGQARDVTGLVLWRVEPEAIASIENGLLHTEDINTPKDITVYAAFTGLEAEITAKVLLPPYIWYVPSDYQTIQAAIDYASNGEVVVVAPGTYTGDGNRDIDFKGKAITVRSTDPNDPSIVAATVINSDGRKGEPHRGFYFHSSEDADSVLAGLTITEGYTNVGGGVHCKGSDPRIRNCTIKENSAEQGGGIYCSSSSPRINGCTIAENTAVYGGGIYCHWENNPVLISCTIAGNTASESAGGIYCSYSSLNLVNCTITRNSAGKDGGGVCCWQSGSKLTNCTIATNTAGFYGGGIRCNRSSHVTLDNCILWGNRAIEGNQMAVGHPFYLDNSTLTITYSDIQGGADYVYVKPGCKLKWGEGNIDADPHFALATDCHIIAASACIDAGTNDPCDGLPTTDIEVVARPLDGDGDGNAVADMGAYEYCPNSPTIAVSALDFYFIQDWPKREPQTLLIRNSGGKPLHWEIVEDCNWLEVTPTSGISNGEVDKVIITIDRKGLSPGFLYRSTFKVQDPNASNNQVTIRVTMPVGTVLQVPSPNYPTIQAAIDAARDFDTVLVADGTYTGPGNKNVNFKGKTITVMGENGPENCIIDCQKAGRGFYFRGGEKENSIVDGFTITNGQANSGGGIYCTGTRPTITNCIIKANSARIAGGIFRSNGPITNCKIIGNSATGSSSGGNFIEAEGGGLYECNGPITNCIIKNNRCTRDGPGGGGLYNCNGPISDCTITGNSAIWNGGGLSECDGPISNCIISGNTAKPVRGKSWGGGLYQCRSPISNCIITGNSAKGEYGHGGGVYFYDIDPWIIVRNCTISGNLAGNSGGGIFCTGGRSKISNCILWDNEAPNGPEIYLSQTNAQVSYSDVQGGWSGEGNIDSNPCFVVGPLGDFYLSQVAAGQLVDSPCVDTGSDLSLIFGFNKFTTRIDHVGDVAIADMGYHYGPINTDPVACIMGGDRAVEVGSDCEARVILDGSCSSDADSTPGTNDDINDFDWYDVVDVCDPNSDIFLGSGEIIESNMPLGEHTIILEVTDKAGAFDANEVTITVEDTTPPKFSLSVEPSVLWPANHKMVEITPSWEVSDNCDEWPEVTLVSITMNEDDDGKGDGHTSDDIQVDDEGICLRAERSGRGSGRVYTITYQAVDDSGNVSVESASVTVPHDRR